MSTDSITIYAVPSSVTCTNQVKYDKQTLETAAAEALKLARQGHRVGQENYPKIYNDREHFSFSSAQPPFFEMPLTEDDTPYDGSQEVGRNFIIVGSVDRDFSSAIYSGTVTYVGAGVGAETDYIPGVAAVGKGGSEEAVPEDRELLKAGEV